MNRMSDGPDRAELAVAVAVGLRRAGLPGDPVRTTRFVQALDVLPSETRAVYLAARATFVSSPAELELFDRLYAEHASAGAPAKRAGTAPEQPTRQVPQERPVVPRTGTPDGAEGDGAAATRAPRPEEISGAKARRGRAPGVGSSADERLARTSFALLGGAELEEVRRLARLAALDAPTRLTHRHVPGARRGPFGARATLRRAARSGTEPDRILRRRRREVSRQVVFLCDVSGSMRPFAPPWLALMQGATAGAEAEAFTFATRLTRVTRQLGGRDPRAGLRRAVDAAPDWSGGTRIVDALREFTDRYGQRGLARDAVLVIISDGREAAGEAAVRREMGRLAKLAHRIIWVNPRWPGSGMPALVGGWAVALPYCHAVRSGHSLTAVVDVLTAIAE